MTPVVKYELLPAQLEFLNIPHNHKKDIALYQGGYGSGKTFAGSLIGIYQCLNYPGIRGLVGAQTYSLVRDTTLQTYFEHLDNMGFVDGVHYNFKTSEGKLNFANGSEILFRHFEEPNKLKSLNLGFVEIEEMSDIPESTFLMLLARLRQASQWGDDFQYRLFGHTNPEMSKGWVYKHFIKEKKSNYRFIHAPSTENIYLPEGYIDDLKSAYDEKYYKINVLGECGDYTSGLVVKNFTDENVRELNYQPDMDLHITCDFNVDPMCWVLAHKTEDKVFYFDEIVLENASTSSTTEHFLDRYPNHKGNIIINGDASGDSRSTQSEWSNYVTMRNIIKRYYPKNDVEVAIRPFNPRIKNRVASFNAMVQDANGVRKLFVSPSCERLLYNIENLKYKEGSSVIDIPTFAQIKNNYDAKFLMHPFDAASYLTEFYHPIKLMDYEDKD